MVVTAATCFLYRLMSYKTTVQYNDKKQDPLVNEAILNH